MNGFQESPMSDVAPIANPTISTGQKKCKKCGASDRNRWGNCRPCKNTGNTAYSNAHRSEMKAWRDANKEKIKATAKKWRASHPESVKNSRAEWRIKHPEKMKALYAKRYAENPERAKAAVAKWSAVHPENNRVKQHKRRARMKKVGGTFSVGDIFAMLKRQRGKCVVCRRNISKNYHIDHIMPLVLGGRNTTSNIQLLCPHCNLSKYDKHPIDFMQEKGFLL
jgi:5-methylcytosine-specific restriction endonuclease McrA